MATSEYNTILDSVPSYASDVAAFARWSENYDSPRPFTLFLDLIGYSDEEFGEPLFDLTKVAAQLGYFEIGQLADALRQYADNPGNVREWVDSLMAAEAGDDEAQS